MRLHEFVNEVNMSYKRGESDYPLGLTGNNANVDYAGLRVLMRPSTFLKLAAPLNRDEYSDENINFMKDYIKAGKPVSPPFLSLDLDEKPYRVAGHEGRHRMHAILEAEGDDPVEVHIFAYGMRRRHFDRKTVDTINRGLQAERSKTTVAGPLFTVMHDVPEKAAIDEVIKLSGEGGDTPAKQFIKELRAGPHRINPIDPSMTIITSTKAGFSQAELRSVPDNPTRVHISFFQAQPQREGIGAEGMRELQSMAAEHGLSLELSVWTKGEVKPSVLKKFYRSMGFVPSKGDLMVWEPAKPVNETLKRVKGKWALVSKSNPKKVLQYYHGSGHPSKEWVSKVERRVHSFSEGVGRITPQNVTKDVGLNQTSIEAEKFGNKVDRDGYPALLMRKKKS